MKQFIITARGKFRFLMIRMVTPAFIKFVGFFFAGKRKSLLVIKNDGIGDYVLFRNFLRHFKNTEKFSDFKIYLLANESCRDLLLDLDMKHIDGYFWYGDDYFLKWKLAGLLFRLQRLRLDTIIYPNYSRKYAVDWLIGRLRAKNKLGVDGDTVNQSPELKTKGNRSYSALIQTEDLSVHEFERNRQIVEAMTGSPCDLKRPFIDKRELNVVPNDGVIVFFGASERKKRWPAAKFGQLCERLNSQLKEKIILAGGKDEIQAGKEIASGFSATQLSNQTGQLTLTQLCELIGGAKLLVSNDTVALHIAVSLNIPVVCIARGDIYGRFVPYPDAIFNKMVMVAPPAFKLRETSYAEWSPENIDDIPVEDVFAACAALLSANLAIN